MKGGRRRQALDYHDKKPLLEVRRVGTETETASADDTPLDSRQDPVVRNPRARAHKGREQRLRMVPLVKASSNLWRNDQGRLRRTTPRTPASLISVWRACSSMFRWMIFSTRRLRLERGVVRLVRTSLLGLWTTRLQLRLRLPRSKMDIIRQTYPSSTDSSLIALSRRLTALETVRHRPSMVFRPAPKRLTAGLVKDQATASRLWRPLNRKLRNNTMSYQEAVGIV
jgi:hypothetical protein